ncbi:MAG: hypothetical protein HN904_29575 [Victivallales bacterium]|nr:hypothetical protein [Victivallales bacterium]
MLTLYIATAVLLLVSLLADRRKTLQGLRIALKRFLKIAPSFAVMLVLVAVALAVVPQDALGRLLTREGEWLGMAGAMSVGSIAAMPGFIAFPLCGILLERGASYAVLAAFSTSLMMVGVATFPLEREYLGVRLAVARNLVSLLIAALVAVAVGLAFGELR